MAGERNRILKLKEYLNTLGVDVNIGKTRARGNKGIFIGKKDSFRIDISKEIAEDKIFPVIIHEFVHYVHYIYDSSLKSLEFVFGDISDDLTEELINITVREIPKDFASALFAKKNELSQEIKILGKSIKNQYPDFTASRVFKPLERGISSPFKYLLKYDRVRVFNKIYSIDELDSSEISPVHINYIRLKSKQRALARINSRISRLNRYYNNPSELLARFCELYFTDIETVYKLAPIAAEKFTNILKMNKIPELTGAAKVIINNI